MTKGGAELRSRNEMESLKGFEGVKGEWSYFSFETEFSFESHA